MAAAFGPPEAVKTLLDAGAKIDAQDYRGFTPLMLAVGTDRYDRRTVNLVLSHGADLHPTNHDGETALDWAYKFADPEVIRSLGGTPKDLAKPVRVSDELPDTRTAIARSIHLLESTSDQFFKKSGCFACHEQPPAEFAAAAARAKGIPVDENASHDRIQQIASTINPVALEGAAALGGADNNLYAVETLVRSRLCAQSHYGLSCGEPGGIAGRRRRMAPPRLFAIPSAGQRLFTNGHGHASIENLRHSGSRRRNEAAPGTRQTMADACRAGDPRGHGHAPGGSRRRGCECCRASQTRRSRSSHCNAPTAVGRSARRFRATRMPRA